VTGYCFECKTQYAGSHVCQTQYADSNVCTKALVAEPTALHAQLANQRISIEYLLARWHRENEPAKKPKVAHDTRILVEALVATGTRLWTTSHNATPAAQAVFRWMRNLARGYLVLEVSSSRAPAIDRVGELLEITSGHEYTIRTIDGREHRWENAMFVRIPQSADDNREIFLLGGGS
jgi:hypothetical protein